MSSQTLSLSYGLGRLFMLPKAVVSGDAWPKRAIGRTPVMLWDLPELFLQMLQHMTL